MIAIGAHCLCMLSWLSSHGRLQEWIIPFVQGALGVPCVHCREQIAHHTLPLCSDCATEIPHFVRPLRLESAYLKQAWCMASYRSVLGSVIRYGKYGGHRSIFQNLGHRLAGAALDLPEIDAVVSVPLPSNRKRHRGFNQSTLLARTVSDLLMIPQYEILFRVDEKEQAAKSQRERKEKLTGRFEVRPHFDPMSIPKKVVIVDDVITTGSTAESCALELLNVGVQEVYVLALVGGS